ncbi:MAG TPA: peptidoglycan-associated lipoprotein Pal [Beijerinckiaceae bacterium]|nr:peptidoglycan-associated lipoprotein Pal [Beijerinckiaceae bacterium]
MNVFKDARALKLVAILGAALAIAACSKNPDELGAGAGGVGLASSGGVATPGSPRDFTVNVGDRVFFDTDSTELSAQAQNTLNNQARWLQRYPNYNFIIEGHADERGTREYNFALGERRAEITKQYLVAKGISPSRMRTISYGKERPVAVCNNESCWSQNRRAVTVLRTRGQS